MGFLGRIITRNDEQITTNPGDIIRYSGNQIVVFYGSNSWAYTRIGHMDMTKEELVNCSEMVMWRSSSNRDKRYGKKYGNAG